MQRNQANYSENFYDQFTELATPLVEAEFFRRLYHLKGVSYNNAKESKEEVAGSLMFFDLHLQHQFLQETQVMGKILNDIRAEIISGKIEDANKLLESAKTFITKFEIIQDQALESLFNFAGYLSLATYTKNLAQDNVRMLAEIALYDHQQLPQGTIDLCRAEIKASADQMGRLIAHLVRWTMRDAARLLLEGRKSAAEEKSQSPLSTPAQLMSKFPANGQSPAPVNKQTSVVDEKSLNADIDQAIKAYDLTQVHRLMGIVISRNPTQETLENLRKIYHEKIKEFLYLPEQVSRFEKLLRITSSQANNNANDDQQPEAISPRNAK